jgi:Zn-dependent peptidase ImmA (M78 family)/transcriptional regulator with XRE-family HTH domain
MLALARDARGVTQLDLVAMLRGAISQAKLSKIENGLVSPGEDEVRALVSALGFRREFFFHPHVRRSEPPTYHRKRKKLSKKDWVQIYAKAEIYRISTALMLRSVELASRSPLPPAIDPDEYNGRVEEIALAIRQFWSLPRGPVEDMVSTLENAGIVVMGFDFGTELCDGFTQHAGDGLPPVIFINMRQSKDRLRFSLAHELGHLVMHRIPNPGMENEANKFASEFLMPTKDIMKDFYNLSLDRFMALKLHWRVSMQSLIYKAHTSGKMTDSAFRYYMMNMSKRGWRSKEPVELTNVREQPRIMRQLVKSHLGPLQYSIEDLASLTGLQPADVDVFFDVEKTPKLRLVV